jgi:hypothetical protein
MDAHHSEGAPNGLMAALRLVSFASAFVLYWHLPFLTDERNGSESQSPTEIDFLILSQSAVQYLSRTSLLTKEQLRKSIEVSV